MRRAFLLACFLFAAAFTVGSADTPKPIKLLFLGDNAGHRPQERFRQLQPVLAARGIDLQYTDKLDALNPQTLAGYDGLVIYANHTRIEPEQEKALLEFVENGKGFIPLHCASYCFLNSPKYIELVGAQFQKHGTGTFRTTIVAPEHPIMKGFRGFESWDETYVHTKHHEKDRTVLEYREEAGAKEPWTWVRTQGKGRVFYTAWGHDERTWGHPGFQNLVERGIRWAVGGDPSVVATYVDRPQMTAKRTDVKPFEYVEANVPFYPPSRQWGTIGEPIKKMQKPLAAAESIKHFVTPAEFEVQLFASEPDIGKPIAMAWDERGRLWLAETVDYPNAKQPEGQGNDRIRICEDTDGDGKADKFTIFAEKLSIPTSLTFWRGGVIVLQAPQTLYLKDTTGDDVADVKEVLFTGWSTADTHAGPSNLQYGLDNWIYGIVGYSGFNGTIAGERQSFRQGFFRFSMLPRSQAPPGTEVKVASFEFLRNTNNNSWGVGLSEEGILFGSTANGNPSEYLPIPNRYYEAVRGWSSTVLTGIAGNPRFEPITEGVRQVDYHGRFTAAAGHALYTARTYPREYWNRTAFVCEPTGHLIATFQLQPNGAGFQSRIGWNLLASDDEWSAPIMAEVGPDGCVWVIDWYNFIVQHNPTPAGFRTGRGAAYETDLRDKKHGRIYRIVPKNTKLPAPLTLKDATPEKLVATLKNDNLFWRRHAQRLLVERGKTDVAPALIELAKDQGVDEIGMNPGVMHALWTLHGLGALDGSSASAIAAAVSALKHRSAGARRSAVQVLPRGDQYVAAICDAGAWKDTDAQVRLATFLALAGQPATDEVAHMLAHVLWMQAQSNATLNDRWLADALTSMAASHDAIFLSGLHRILPLKPEPQLLTLVERVAEHFARGAPVDKVGNLMVALPRANEALAASVVAGFARGWPRDRPAMLDAGTERALAELLKKLPPASRGQLVLLATRWGSKELDRYAKEISEGFLAQVRSDKESDANRIAAAGQLIDFRKSDADAAKAVLEQITPQSGPEFGRGLIDALGRSEAAEVGKMLLGRLPTLTPALQPAALRVLLSRTEWTQALLAAIDQGKVELTLLTLDQRQSLAAHPTQAIADEAKKLLARGGGLPNPDRQKVIEQFLPLTKRTGDAVAGKVVFKNQCLKCHTHSGEGTKIGPDLTGIAVHPKEHLLTEIMDPSRSVEGNYRQYVVSTKGGQIFTGLLASETRTAIELFDTEGKKHTLLREDVDELKATAKSLMPEGFEKLVSANDVANLLEYMTQKGKYLPLPLDKVATVTTTRGMFFSETAQAERLVFRDWSPKTFEGIPFVLVDPQTDRARNAILLYGPTGAIPPKMPKSVRMSCQTSAKAIHMLGGVSGWGYPASEKGTVSMVVRLHYADGKTEDHELKNGEHFADYIRRVDVPQSKFAFALRGQQLRYLAIVPQRKGKIAEIEFVKGPDGTAPIVMAVTVETGVE